MAKSALAAVQDHADAGDEVADEGEVDAAAAVSAGSAVCARSGAATARASNAPAPTRRNDPEIVIICIRTRFRAAKLTEIKRIAQPNQQDNDRGMRQSPVPVPGDSATFAAPPGLVPPRRVVRKQFRPR
jgi:hypothetical protein